MINTALRYAENGWAIFPVHSVNKNGECSCRNKSCKHKGKHPIANLAPNGFRNATKEIGEIAAWWKKHPTANIGLATGKKSGNLLVVDIDQKPEKNEYGEEQWEGLCIQHTGSAIGYPDTVESITGSGGKHIFFYYPENSIIKSRQKALGEAVDIRADGGYVILPPSIHVTGNVYSWELSSDPEDIDVAMAPDWLILQCQHRERPQPKNSPETIQLTPEKVNELRGVLAFIPSDDRDVWLEIGMALKSTYAGIQAYGIWNEWSQQSTKFDLQDQQKTWESLDPDGGVSIASLYYRAQKNGWCEPTVIDHNLVPNLEDVKILEIREPVQAPVDLHSPPGVLKDITNYILNTSKRPQPSFAVNAALTFAGAILGRRVAGETGLRTNLYLISVGSTASGKDHPRAAVKTLLMATNKIDYLGGENIASGQAILTRLAVTPSVLFLLDEFGMLLQSIQSHGAGRHNKEIITNFMKLFSSAGTIYVSTEYADQKQKPRITLEYPCVSLHATTTAEEFYPALTSMHVVNGYLNRFLVVDESYKPRPKRLRTTQDIEIPETIIDWVNYIDRDFRGDESNLSGLNPETPIRIEKDPDAREIFNTFEDDVEELLKKTEGTGVDALWGRAWEHAEKLAVIGACCTNPDTKQISAEVAEWAISFVRYYTEQLAITIHERVSDSDFEKVCKEYLMAIARAGENGLTNRDIGRQKPFSLHPPRERKATLEALKSSVQIDYIKIERPGKGRKRMAYVAIQG